MNYFIILITIAIIFINVTNASTVTYPNIIHIISDDLSSKYKGPNMNKLSKDGITYSKAYIQYSVCSPSRSSFLTGRFAEKTDALALTFVEKVFNETTIPFYLKQLGYHTVRFGKVFHWDTLDGIQLYDEHWSDWSFVDSNRANSECKHGLIGCRINEKKSSDYKVANGAISFIRNAIQPFYLAIGFHRPHLNNAVADKYFTSEPIEMVNTTMITSTKSLNYYECDDLKAKKMYFGNKIEPIVSLKYKRRNGLEFIDKSPNEVIGISRFYRAAVMHMDAQLGRVINALKKNGYYNNSLIIFHSDHGFHNGEHGMWGKNSLYDDIVRVPLIIKGNGFNKGTIVSSPVSLIDIFPTILQYIGIKPIGKLSGKPLPTTTTNDRVAITQYPRCLSYGSVQSDDCMFTTHDICNTLKPIKYMGYSIRQQIGYNLYTLIIWKPYLTVRNGCGIIAPGTVSKFPLVDKKNSKTYWNKPSLDTMLLINETIQITNYKLQVELEQLIVNTFK